MTAEPRPSSRTPRSVPERRPWLLSTLMCAAMLVLPALTWLLAPHPHGFAPPPAPPSTAPVAAPTTPPPTSTPHSVRPASFTRPPRADSSATPAEAGPVAGIVLDVDGHPAKQATVRCDDRDPPLVATTDDEGRFQLDAEAAGCTAVARHPEAVESERVALVAGASNMLRLSRGGGIEGDVVDERGAPVAAYMIAIESYQGRSSDAAQTGQVKNVSDARGAFGWDRLVPGRYVLVASAEGRPPSQSRQVEVEIGRTSAHVRITLGRGATMSGRVIDAVTKKPLPGAVVMIDRATATRAGEALHPARADDAGAYTLEGAPMNGPFSVSVTREGYRQRIVTGLTARGSPTLHQDIELNPGAGGQDFAGIGAFLAPAPTGVTFAGLVAGGPAEQAGLLKGDLIRRIDGADASEYTLSECMQNLRGPDGSRVTVQVERGGKRVDVSIQRRALTL